MTWMGEMPRRCLFCEGEQGVWHDMAACAYELAEQRAAWRQERFWLHIALALLYAWGGWVPELVVYPP